ncbi:ROK family protein [Terriglobus roseus]|uniref:Glucokinase n=1 Tax=Terriglobus roseus TaxID=392734 RepID=A0A1G7GSW5_9BACT|nr:ROK family protein [Terriglobus roseus]SDE91235.1 glucokinase [Terriglobus roseus]
MRHAIGIDLGGSHVSIGIVREHSLLTSRDIPVKATRGLAPLLPDIRNTVLSLLQEVALLPSDCMGIALSLPSLVDFYARKIASVNDKYPDAQTINLEAWCNEAFGLPIAVENDARMALLGEAVAGSAQQSKDVVMLTLGTGVGCAVMLNGKLMRTAAPQGGNLGGHIPVRLDGRPCTCGAIGCMESEASGWALPLIARERADFHLSALSRETTIDFETVFRHSDAGDELAQQLLQHCIHVWSVGAVGLVHAYGPELMVFGGGVSTRAGDVLPAIHAYVQRHAWAPAGDVKIVQAQLGNRSPLYAAIPLLEELSRGR